MLYVGRVYSITVKYDMRVTRASRYGIVLDTFRACGGRHTHKPQHTMRMRQAGAAAAAAAAAFAAVPIRIVTLLIEFK